MRALASGLVLVLGVSVGCAGAVAAVPVRPAVEASHGMVVTRHALASRAGVATLRAGGNAIDAAVSVCMTLAVVLPQAGNLGGGGFLTFHDAASGSTHVVDFREVALGEATPDMYLDASGGVDVERARIGALSTGVPGSVAGLAAAWRRWGRLPWPELVRPAIVHAESGFAVNAELAAALQAARAKLARFPETATIFLDAEGAPLQAGARLRQPQLAATLRTLARDGARAFYEGPIADAIVATQQRHGGVLTAADLTAYRPRFRRPIWGRYRGLEIASVPPPSSGGITLLQILGMLERDPAFPQRGRRSAATVHRVVECMARAFADRNHWLGDPDFVTIPRHGLLAPAYLQQRFATISADRATPSRFIHPGPVWRYDASVPRPAVTPDSARARLQPESDQTTHVSIVDAEGNAVALSTTLNSSFGSGLVVAGAGFLLNNEMDDFVAKPGVPNQFGLVGSATNGIEPGKRMLSSMSPTLVFRAGRPWLVLGARGGPRIISAVLEVVLDMHDFGQDVATAVAAGRFHHQWWPDVIACEDDAFSGGVRTELAQRGHRFTRMASHKSSVQVIEIDTDGILRGASDPRTQGRAIGY